MLSAGAEVPERLAKALERAGRVVSQRRVLAVSHVEIGDDELGWSEMGGKLPLVERGTLRWTVRSLVGQEGAFLELHDIGPERWDLELARTLSAELDGFVSVLDRYSNIGRWGEVLFFAGRTIEARSWGAVEGDLRLGPPLTDEEELGVHVGALYRRRFCLLCDGDELELDTGRLLAAEDWTVGPPTRDFDPTSESGFALILIAGKMDPERLAALDLALAAPGWRTHVHRSSWPGIPPCIELRREGRLDEALLVELSARLMCPAAGVDVPGGGRAHRWMLVHQGMVEHHGESNSGNEFIKTLGSISHLFAEGPGMLFGRGC